MDWAQRESKLNVRVRLRFSFAFNKYHSFTEIIEVRMVEFDWVFELTITFNVKVVWDWVSFEFFDISSCQWEERRGCILECTEDEGLQMGQ